MSQAVVVLPAGIKGPDAAASDRRWLARARLSRDEPASELLQRVLQALGIAPPATGLGALRLWGQTGAPPSGWIAAADPVYLEARLDHVCLFALPATELPTADLREIFAVLQAALGAHGDDGACTFELVGAHGYLRSDRALATTAVSARTAHGASPDIYLPEGPDMQAHDRLQSEVQMCLHEAEVNRRRAQAGLRPVNSLWFWGGGTLSPQEHRDLPPLHANEPLLRGYWQASGGIVADWPGSFETCAAVSGHAFVAVVPEAEAAAGNGLASLQQLLSSGRLQALTVLFRDGLQAEFRRSDRFRFWRRASLRLPEGKRP